MTTLSKEFLAEARNCITSWLSLVFGALALVTQTCKTTCVPVFFNSVKEASLFETKEGAALLPLMYPKS